nr:hypothetical protein [uncultured Campylobacter sp.]
MKRIGLIACCAAMALHGEVFTLGQVEVVEKVGGVQKSDANVVVLDEQKLQRDEIKRLSEVAYSTPGVYVDKKGPRAECRFISTVFLFISRMTAMRTLDDLRHLI